MNLLYLNICIIFLIIALLYIKIDLNKKHPIFEKSYLINLKNTKVGRKRWELFKKYNVYYPYTTRFNGIYGKTYNYENEIKKNIIVTEWDYGKWKFDYTSKIIPLTKGEIGVSLSHYYVWKTIVDNNINIALIQEDDSVCHKNTDKYLNRLMNYLPENWDIFLLDFWNHTGDNDLKINKYIWKVNNFALMNCYLINNKGAKKLLKYLPIDKPLDTWLSSISNKVNIYRHNYINPKYNYPKSILVNQSAQGGGSFIDHTNNW